MALSIPLADIIAFPKVSKAYFSLLEVLCHNHTGVIANCDSATFTFLVSSLDAGLKALDVSISSMCATAVDNLAGFYFKAVNSDETPPQAAQVGSESPAWSALIREVRVMLPPAVTPQTCSAVRGLDGVLAIAESLRDRGAACFAVICPRQSAFLSCRPWQSTSASGRSFSPGY